MQKNTRAARSKANPTARESDVTSDPAYKQKVAFYEHLETQRINSCQFVVTP